MINVVKRWIFEDSKFTKTLSHKVPMAGSLSESELLLTNALLSRYKMFILDAYFNQNLNPRRSLSCCFKQNFVTVGMKHTLQREDISLDTHEKTTTP